MHNSKILLLCRLKNRLSTVVKWFSHHEMASTRPLQVRQNSFPGGRPRPLPVRHSKTVAPLSSARVFAAGLLLPPPTPLLPPLLPKLSLPPPSARNGSQFDNHTLPERQTAGQPTRPAAAVIVAAARQSQRRRRRALQPKLDEMIGSEFVAHYVFAGVALCCFCNPIFAGAACLFAG